MHVRYWYLVQTFLISLELWDLLNFQRRNFRFFCIQLTFIISDDCCTTVISSSFILAVILFPDLVVFKFRHVSSFWYFKTFFEWVIYLVANVGSFACTWVACLLKLCLYDKSIPFLCYQHFKSLYFAKRFFDHGSLISNFHLNMFYLNF